MTSNYFNVFAFLCLLIVFVPAELDAQRSPWRRANGTEGNVILALDIYRGNPDTLYAVGDRGFMLSTDRGENWTNVNSWAASAFGPLRVDPTNSQLIYLSKTIGYTLSVIVMSTNGGQSWRLLFGGPFISTNVIEIDPVDYRTVYAGFGQPNWLFRSTDQGQTWDTIARPPGYWLTSIAIAASNNSVLYTGYFTGVFKSTDRANSWIPLPFISSLQEGLRLAVDPRDANIVYATFYGLDTSQLSGVFKSTDGGFNWFEKNNGLRLQDRTIHTIVINPKNPSDLFIGVSNDSGNLIFRSTNGGEEWFGFSNGLPRVGGVSSIAIDTLNNRAYATTGGVYILDDITTEVFQSTHETPWEISLYQNYPNPFNPATKIKYGLPFDSYVSIKVFDVLGRVVATLADQNQRAGWYEVNFDASRLSSGVYFYRMTSGNFTQTRKLLLMK